MVTVNGSAVNNVEKMTLKDYLIDVGYALSQIAVEYNGEIIDREDLGKKQLKDGDLIEIIKFMGGGRY